MPQEELIRDINEHAEFCQECRPPDFYCEAMRKLIAELIAEETKKK